MPLNPAEVFELHVRCVEGLNLKQVISGTLSPYVVLSGNLVGDADGKVQTPPADSAGPSPQWNHKFMVQVRLGEQLTLTARTRCFTGDVDM